MVAQNTQPSPGSPVIAIIQPLPRGCWDHRREPLCLQIGHLRHSDSGVQAACVLDAETERLTRSVNHQCCLSTRRGTHSRYPAGQVCSHPSSPLPSPSGHFRFCLSKLFLFYLKHFLFKYVGMYVRIQNLQTSPELELDSCEWPDLVTGSQESSECPELPRSLPSTTEHCM